MITEREWPLKDRISRCLDLMEDMDKYKNDQLFYPSPMMIKASLLAAREALNLLTDVGDKG